MKVRHIVIVALALCGVGAALWSMKDRNENMQIAGVAELTFEGRMPSFDNATAWLNAEPLKDASLRGKVVLVEFWTYSCINWRRQLPYVRAWEQKYKDKGLVVVGVHTPEFAFEKSIENVRTAVGQSQVSYPVALDNDYAVWEGFANRYWPALYFVDARGNIRHRKFGEGDYEQSERIIQQLLREAGSTNVDTNLVSINPTGPEAAADWETLRSQEMYFGYDRAISLAAPEAFHPDKVRKFSYPDKLRSNNWALTGEWNVGKQATSLKSASGGVRLRFQARDVHVVMGPGESGKPIRFRVLIDGQPPGPSHGVDVDEQGRGTIIEPRMYQLIRQPNPISEKVVEIEFLEMSAEIFSVTFG